MTWTPPNTKRIMQVVDRTWSAAEFIPCGPFTLRRGRSGGKRVSSASVEGAFTPADIQAVTAEMARIGQPELFQISDSDGALDATLNDMGYDVIDRVTLFAVQVDSIADIGKVTQMSDPPADMIDVWADAGIGEGRLDVMRRVYHPKSYLLQHHDSQPAALAFVGCDKDTAMIHAIEVQQFARRKGYGQAMLRAAAAWVQSQGGKTLTLVVLSDNKAACALYRSVGMIEVGKYHYRINRGLQSGGPLDT